MWLFALMLILSGTVANAADYYVSPGGSGSTCSQASPCSMSTGMNNAVGSDRVRFLNGTYTLPGSTGFRSIRNGTSSTSRLTYESVNPRGAILRFNGSDDNGGQAGDTLIIEHNNIIVRGFEIHCTSSSGNNAWDCVQANGTRRGVEVQNVLFENLYAHDSGHQLFGCYLARNIELRNSTFDFSAIDSEFGEALYLTSSVGSGSDAPCNTVDIHHNLFGRFGGNAADFKSQTRNVVLRDSIFIDKRTQIGNETYGGDGDFISQNPNNGTTAAGNVTRDTISYRVIPNYIWKASDGHRLDFINNVIWDYVPTQGSAKQINSSGTDVSSAVSSGNIHCPSQGVSNGPDYDQGGTPNLVNRPYSECTTRINQILGQPTISSCEIGSIDNTTLVVNFNVAKNGPISSAGTAGQLAVTYDAASQTESSITLPSDSQARITMASAPSSGQSVQISAASGVIKNSAFIGGQNCNMPLATIETDPGGSNRTPNKILNGNGVCGSNATISNFSCTNNVGGPPVVESLDQAVWRFYEAHGGEGANPLAPENSNIAVSLGSVFRWRVGVRGGGSDEPSRAYELAARLCNPTCGSWGKVISDFSVRGITYQNDLVQTHLTPTTNQLSLGGKTFSAGVFIEQNIDTPAVAIATTQQVEWEFSLIIPEDSSPLVSGNWLELRIQHGDGTALSAYTAVPSITIGSAGSGLTGSFTGGIIQ